VLTPSFSKVVCGSVRWGFVRPRLLLFVPVTGPVVVFVCVAGSPVVLFVVRRFRRQREVCFYGSPALVCSFFFLLFFCSVVVA
jgi:hypothetical protein